jgi:hypothetical protein
MSSLTPVTGLLGSRLSGQIKMVKPVRLTIRNGAASPLSSFVFSLCLDHTVMLVMASSTNADVRLTSSRSAALMRTLSGLLPGLTDVR